MKMNKKPIIDVRTPEEFSAGHASGSLNIPLHEIILRVDEIKQLSQPVILCCASGNRSTQAELLLRKKGIDCINAGSWTDVDLFIEATGR